MLASSPPLPLGGPVTASPSRRARIAPAAHLTLAARDKASPAALEMNAPRRDNFFELLAIRHLNRTLQKTSGCTTDDGGYESLAETTMMISWMYDSKKQQHIVMESLKKIVPDFAATMVKMFMPASSRITRQMFAFFTPKLFAWLVGPCEVRKTDSNGVSEKNVVYIPKCRFFESTNCIGMCMNMCKIPTQNFMKDSFGMPVYMLPNYEDMSCEMIFGQHPPDDDPTLKQQCNKTRCFAKQMRSTVPNDREECA